MGNEYIQISGTTQNNFVMQVFGFKAGNVDVVYSWGQPVLQPVLTPAPVIKPVPVLPLLPP